MRSFYLQIRIYAIEKWPFSGAYPLIYSDCRSFYMRIHYMRAYFWSPYLSHITRSTVLYRFKKIVSSTSLYKFLGTPLFSAWETLLSPPLSVTYYLRIIADYVQIYNIKLYRILNNCFCLQTEHFHLQNATFNWFCPSNIFVLHR